MYPLDYVQKAVFFLEQFDCLPDSGGWSDQDEALIDDIMTYVDVRDSIEWEVEHEVNTDYEPIETETRTIRLDEI